MQPLERHIDELGEFVDLAKWCRPGLAFAFFAAAPSGSTFSSRAESSIRSLATISTAVRFTPPLAMCLRIYSRPST